MVVASLSLDFATTLRAAVAPVSRTRRLFVEQDVIFPDGPRKNEPYTFDSLPFQGVLLDEMDRGWPEIFITGPSQSGKTFIAHVIPPIYVVAELRRNVVIGMPDGRMVQNKWQVDFEPVFRASPKLRQLLPSSGPGSRGGTIKDTIQLTNGAVIKFMTAGGDDTSRAGFTAEGGVYVTEVARFSSASEQSQEADRLDQLRARMQSMQRKARRLVGEGTGTTEQEYPWSAFRDSTQSRLVTKCPNCGDWNSPEREHLVGWHEAKTELEAAELAWWACPNCGEEITEPERRAANQAVRILHVGQSIDERGRIHGDLPKTERLWFRWSMWHNLLLTGGDVAVDEWKKERLDPDSEAYELAEKKLCQFVWAIPYKAPSLVIEALGTGDISRRASDLPKGELPSDTKWIAIGVDLGMYWMHWVAIAFRELRCAHVFDYETMQVLGRGEGESAVERREAAELRLAKVLDVLFDRCKIGWPLGGQRKGPDRILIDAGWLGDEVVYPWCAQRGTPFFAAIGRGTGQRAGHVYTHPTKLSKEVREIGEGYHIRRHPRHRTKYFVNNSDHWKSAVHRMLRVASEQPGSLSLFRDQQHNHRTYEKHVLAERLTKKAHPKHGSVEVWENPDDKPNHFLDATYEALVGGYHAGFRVGTLTAAVTAARPNQGGSSWWAMGVR